jgi:outer membrane protein assembly factor BamA
MSFYAQSVAQYRTTAFTYVNMERRLQYAIQGFSQDLFYYGQNSGALYDPLLAPFVTRDLAESVQSQRGGTIFGIYPFSRDSRVEVYTGYLHLSEHYTNDALQQAAQQYQVDQFGTSLLRNGHMVPLGVTFVNETTIFRDYGPVAGRALKVSYDGSPSLGSNWISRNTLDLDSRYYQRIASNGVFALRFRGLKSWGRNPDFMYYGGNSEMRGYDYLEFIGNKGFFANAELRFPLIEAMLTPIGVLGGLRGVFFANMGATGFNNQPFKVMTRASEVVTPLAGYTLDDQGNLIPRAGAPFVLDGLRLVDGRASYGFGLESFLLGFPMHFDWSWKTLFNKTWEGLLNPTCTQTSATNVDCSPDGAAFRKMKFDFWIGYDF